MNLHFIGLPSIGKYRELKSYTELFWKNYDELNLINLLMISKKIRIENIFTQIVNNSKYININDFSNYDFILDFNCLINSINNNNEIINIKKYFSIARGDYVINAVKLTKFFNTNYHYIIPGNFNNLKLLNNKIFKEINEVKKLGFSPKIILIGPITYYFISLNKKNKKKLKQLLEIYIYLIKKIKKNNINNIQFEEPILCMKLNNEFKNIFDLFYKNIQTIDFNLILTTYFGNIKHNKNIIEKLKKVVLHIENDYFLNTKHDISIGIIDNYLSKKNLLNINKKNNIKLISFNFSCKFLPYDLSIEYDLKYKKFLSFYFQKINEMFLIKKIFNKNFNNKDILYLKHYKLYKKKIEIEKKIESKKKGKIIKNKKLLTNTTIGSFPQNIEVRISRKLKYKKILKNIEYLNIIKENIYLCLIKQKKLNINIYTNGEFERSDMVEYFSNNINIFLQTKNGWVQSYGTRCVKPPIIINIFNSKNLTENWIFFLKKICKKNIKIILSGPITILKWSFCLYYNTKYFLCLKISEIIKKKINKLLKIKNIIFQIDEPTIKECLPLYILNWKKEINNFIFCFNNCTNNLKKNQEIHTHICYSVFNDIINMINNMNINLLTIESIRENLENVYFFKKINLSLGAGLYDIHCPIVPYKNNIKKNFYKFLNIININKIWINPDCGLKTRNWFEIEKTFNVFNQLKNKIINNYL